MKMNFISYIPQVLIWLFFSIRARSFTFFSAVNPEINLGGLFNYSKWGILKYLPEEYLPKTILVNLPEENTVVSKEIDKIINYPIVIKPDLGERGRGVAIIKNQIALKNSLELLPPGKYLIQEYIDYENEIGVMYVKLPGTKKGTITSLAFKTMGTDKIGNMTHGAKIFNACSLISEDLTNRIEFLSSFIPKFYFGRFDIKVKNIISSADNWELKIIEINGANSQPLHMYDPNIKFPQEIKITFKNWLMLFRISRINHSNGFQYTSIIEVLKEFLTFIRRNRRYKKMSLYP